MLQCARKHVATGFISVEILPRIQFILKMNSIIEQFFLVGDGKEGKLEFASQSQELFKCQGVNFTDRITMQLHPRLDGEEKSLTREDGRSMIGWNAVHPCFILTKILGTLDKRGRTKLSHTWLPTFIPHLGLQLVKTFWIMVQWPQLLGPVERLAGHYGEVGD